MEICQPKYPYGDLRWMNFSLNAEYGSLGG